MNYKYFLFFLFLIFLFFLPRKPYQELNHLHIIDSMEVYCSSHYSVILHERIPHKEADGVVYQSKDYSFNHKSLIQIKKEIDKDSSFYYEHITSLKTNCSNSSMIISLFHIYPKKIKS